MYHKVLRIMAAILVLLSLMQCIFTLRRQNGGLSSVEKSTIANYIKFLQDSITNSQWKHSVQSLSELINRDPVLRMNWQFGISQCVETLPGKTGKDVLDLINTALNTGPSFDNSDLVAFPINAILVEFMQNEKGKNFLSHPQVNKQFKRILSDYSMMIESSESLRYMNEQSPNGWFSKEAKDLIDYDLFECDPSQPYYGFKNWNQLFLRQFKKGVRKIGAGSPNGISQDNIIVNSCQSTPLVLPLQPVRQVKLTDSFWLKDDHYSLTDMFGQYSLKKGYSSLFDQGTVYQGYLSPDSYHRWHAPLDGTIVDVYSIPGTYFLDQFQVQGHFDRRSPDIQSFLSSVAARMVIILKAKNKKFGYVAIIYVGMAEVSSCVATVKPNDKVKKGDQIGHFSYGGSTHVIIFQKDVKLTFANTLYQDKNGIKKGVRQNLYSYLAHV